MVPHTKNSRILYNTNALTRSVWKKKSLGYPLFGKTYTQSKVKAMGVAIG